MPARGSALRVLLALSSSRVELIRSVLFFRDVRELAPGRSVLNLFAYTATAGVAAAAAGASEVWNVDFSRSALEVGRANAASNSIPEDRIRFVEEDCLPVLRHLAGLTVRGRGSHRRRATGRIDA